MLLDCSQCIIETDEANQAVVVAVTLKLWKPPPDLQRVLWSRVMSHTKMPDGPCSGVYPSSFVNAKCVLLRKQSCGSIGVDGVSVLVQCLRLVPAYQREMLGNGPGAFRLNGGVPVECEPVYVVRHSDMISKLTKIILRTIIVPLPYFKNNYVVAAVPKVIGLWTGFEEHTAAIRRDNLAAGVVTRQKPLGTDFSVWNKKASAQCLCLPRLEVVLVVEALYHRPGVWAVIRRLTWNDE